MRDTATSLSCQLTVLIASGKTDGSFRSFTSTQRKWLPAECQAEHQACENLRNSHFKAQGKPQLTQNSFRLKKPGIPMWFSSPGADRVPPPEALGLLCFHSSSSPRGLTDRQGRTQGQRAPFTPLPKQMTARGGNPRGNHSQA